MLFGVVRLFLERGCELGGASIVDLVSGYLITGAISFAFLAADNPGS